MPKSARVRASRCGTGVLGAFGRLAAVVGAALPLLGCSVDTSDEPVGSSALAASTASCAFQAPAGIVLAQDKEFVIKLPSGVPIDAVALGTTGDKLEVSPQAQVLAGAAGFGTLSAVESAGGIRIGPHADVGNVFSESAGVTLDPQAHVHGFIKTASTVARGPQSVVDGPVSENATLRPLDTVRWTVAFPQGNQGGCNVGVAQTLALQPGAYGDITVGVRARLKLRAGRYFFRKLKFQPQAVLEVDRAAGQVSVYVDGNFDFTGEVVATPSAGPDLFVGVTGTSSTINGLFRGVVVAPWGTVTFHPNSEHRGAFFAKKLSVQPSAVIRHAPLFAVSICESNPSACSTTCRCPAGGSCAADVECRAGLVCVGASPAQRGVCQPADIDDGNPCTLDELDPATGPVHRPHPPGTSCADGDACDGDETCDGAGVCAEGAPPALDDDNPCTMDACTPEAGVTHLPVTAGTACGDENECNGVERCDAGGHCLPGEPPVVDDGNPCTSDVCDPSRGVEHGPLPSGASCADANPCNGSETCDGAGACLPGTALPVDDGNPCTSDRCDPATGVRHEPVPVGTSCADSDRCNGDETCSAGGQCVGNGPQSVDDGNPCTEDSCDPGSGPRHTPRPAGTPCDNDNVCDGVSVCDANGACVARSPPVVDDQNPCTLDTCDPVLGVRHEPVPSGTSCEDGDACNGAEQCSPTSQCEPGAAPVVDDGNPCTVDTCDPADGVRNEPAPPETSCADDDLCNGNERCDGAGSCRSGAAAPLDDANPCTADSCHPTLGVLHEPVTPGTSCSDLDACNGEELCNATGACVSGQAPEVDDANPCTVDGCEPALGPVHEPAPAGTSCADADACNGTEVCDGTGSCHAGEALDLLAIASPSSGLLTREASVTVAGTSRASSDVTITIDPGGSSVTLAGGTPQPFSLSVPLVEGENLFTVRALDTNACSDTETLVVTRDSVVPSISLQAPDSLTPGAAAQAIVSANDASGIAEVRLSVSLASAVVFSLARPSPPYLFDFTVPAEAVAGDTLIVEVQAFDQAGNVALASKTLVVKADAMVVGRILSDASGQPVAGASVRLGTIIETAGSDGRYALTATGTEALVRAWRSGFTTAERRASIELGTGSVVFDARLTPLAEPLLVSGDDVTIGAELARWDGQPVSAVLAVPAAAFDEPVAVHFTALSPQGLPALLPHGWSPVAAFEVRLAPTEPDVPETDPEAGFPALDEPLGLTLSGLPEGALGFVAHDRAAHGWRSLGTLAATGGETTTSLAGLGAYAVVIGDAAGAPSVSAPGALLSGLAAVPLPLGVTAQAAGVPASLPAGGGVAQGRVVIPSAASLPSGTMLTAAVHEAYGLVEGNTATTEIRLQDLVLYRAQVPSLPGIEPGLATLLGATFPLAPSMTFEAGELGAGKIHIDLKAGRETHRGKIGGRAPVVVEHAGATLSIAAGSLEGDTIMDVERIDVPAFAFRSTELVPLGAAYLDFTGAVLSHGADFSLSGLALAPEETPLLARMERVDAIAQPFVVALGSYNGAHWTFSDGDGFAGIVKEGTYVVYRAALPLGFVAGTTSAAGSPVRALVSVQGLPFVAPSALDGTYKLPSRPIEATVSARVPGTNLSARETALVADGNTTSVDLVLEGEVTVAAVTPTDGAVSVPRTTQIELTTPVALDAATVTEDNIKLFAGDPLDNVLVAVRLQLSASARSLAVIPETRLDPGTDYTLQASGLRDTLSGIVVVPVTSFMTVFEVPPTVDTGSISVSIPEDGGNATVTSPPGTLRPGTTVIIANEGNGHVTSCTVGNSGALDCEIPASIDDTLVISVTDPDGNTTTSRHGQYQLADGRTAVGPAGGVVTGPGGVELRIPEGAIAHAVKFNVAPVGLETIPERPFVPGTEFASAVRVEVEGNPFFAEELDLAFPRPVDAPEGAFYYVFRRLRPPSGHGLPGGAAYEVIDHAFLQGTGSNARVVTASCPFVGVRDAVGTIGKAGAALTSFGFGSLFALSGRTAAQLRGSAFDAFAAVGTDNLGHESYLKAILDPGGWLLESSVFVLAYTADALAPSVPRHALIRGRVVRPKSTSTSGVAEFEPIAGATVTGFDASGNPLTADPGAILSPPPSGQLAPLVATTQHDGTFSLWDPFPTAGVVQIRAALPQHSVFQPCPSTNGADDVIRCTTAAQEIVATCTDNARLYRNQTKANITFPPSSTPTGPSRPPPVQIGVMQVVGGQRQLTGGFSVMGVPVILGFRAAGHRVQSVTVSNQGVVQSPNVYDDPLSGQMLGWDRVADFNPASPGTYTVTVTAIPSFQGPPITGTSSFRVVAPGGDATDPVTGEAPAVVGARTIPQMQADDVSVGVFPQITFTEPVRNLTVPNNVRLLEVGGDPNRPSLEATLVGVQRNGQPVQLVSTETAVTSLTIEPALQLKFNASYKLTVGGSISDLDDEVQGANQLAKTLEPSPYEIEFRTARPQVIGGTVERFSSAGIVTVGDHAFLAENNFISGMLRMYDVSSPSLPVEIASAQRQMAGRPMDIDAASAGSTVHVAVVTGPADESFPSNLRLYEVRRSGASWESAWVAGSTLASTALEGIVRRVALKGDFAYTLTTNKGVQFVDLTFARDLFVQRGGDTSRIRIPFNSDAQGFGHEAVVATIPVFRPDGRLAFLNDFRVVIPADGFSQAVIAITGELPLVLMDPLTGDIAFPPAGSNGLSVLFPPPPSGPAPPEPPPTGLTRGRAIELIRRNNRDIAVVVGEHAQEGQSKLVTLDITSPSSPRVIGEVGGLVSPTDVWIKDDYALVAGASSVSIVNLQRPAKPFVAGEISNLGGRLSTARNGSIIASQPSPSGGDVPLGGIRAATFGKLATTSQVDPVVHRQVATGAVNENQVLYPFDLKFDLYGASANNVRNAQIVVGAVSPDGGQTQELRRLPVVLTPGPPEGGPSATATARVSPPLAFPAGHILTAVSEFQDQTNTYTGPVTGLQSAELGLRLDSNNDTIIGRDVNATSDGERDAEEADRAAADRGESFQFWNAGREFGSTVPRGRCAAVNSVSRDDLVDWATAQVRVPPSVKQTTFVSVGLAGAGQGSNADWYLGRKLQRGKGHLSDESTADEQAAALTTELCRSDANGEIDIPLAWLQAPDGANELVFACWNCTADVTRLVLTYRPQNLPEQRAEAAVKVQALENMMSMYTARPTSSNPTPTQHSPLARLQLSPGWASIPAQAQNILVTVHGFNVSDSDATRFSTTYLKRLYWVGHPVLSRQGQDPSAHPWVIGISWPGDEGLVAELYLPSDEFHAFQTGVPLALFLSELKRQNSARVLKLIAHSLGNIVVNSALAVNDSFTVHAPQPPLQHVPDMNGVVDTYIMNDAAVSAEAFATDYTPDPYLVSQAEQHGYPVDQMWTDEWIDMNRRHCGLEDCDLAAHDDCSPAARELGAPHSPNDELLAWCGLLDEIDPEVRPPPRYAARWRTARYGNSPWRGIFALNPGRVRRLFNTYNSDDDVLNPIWFTGMSTQKPDVGFLGMDRDSRGLMFWAPLRNTASSQEYLWREADPGDTHHANQTRRWAELAYWFLPTAEPAGAFPVIGPSGAPIENVALTQFAQGAGPFDSHSYMLNLPLAQVWCAHELFHQLMTSGVPAQCSKP